MQNGRRRVFVENVRPEIDGGRWPIKRVLGDRVDIDVDVFTDGHDALAGVLLYRRAPSPRETDPPWSSVFLTPSPTKRPDRFLATFAPTSIGLWEYTVEAWVDHFGTFQRDTKKRIDAGQDVALELLDGARLVELAASRAQGEDAGLLADHAAELRNTAHPIERRIALALAPELAARVRRYPDKTLTTRYSRTLELVVDPVKARFSSWYEFFPRSCGKDGKHGTFADAEERLPYVAEMGFDVIYLPPIHPIGTAHRKGPNNTLVAGPSDPGSPWAIGAAEGGHKAVHPELGTLEDFDRFLAKAKSLGIDIALDIAYQTSPDHPYVKEHPEWFKKRADGTIRYAENPPKKYQDVYPFDFECDEWKELWLELKSVFDFWIARGVKIFRVDNPHTKPLTFWAWCIRSIKQEHPEVIFLAEAFTRPAVMYGLAKLGFTQSYTYFTWRVAKAEIEAYLEELTQTEIAEYYRPNFWPNTPDILPEHLQTGLRSMFIARLVLASMLSSNYGMYGPAFELMEHVPRPGAEEYIDNEKFELKRWDLDRPDSLRHLIARVNRIRRENPALQENRGLRFHETDNDLVICFSKVTDRDGNTIVVVINLDPYHKHGTWIDLDLPGIADPERTFQVHDLLSDARYIFRGRRNYVELDPATMPAHIFRVRRFVRTENDFEYFL
ncbi:alpha-1,4-glucan--maltose-1-phosphate maltosyltransferase [Polyangium aurulentum]|nr:alpha-1,4-glucan--maltose-1-phosphate maltosyltransferase [Polyangium aurulentum]